LGDAKTTDVDCLCGMNLLIGIIFVPIIFSLFVGYNWERMKVVLGLGLRSRDKLNDQDRKPKT
jgi:hypothetical protein